MITNSTERVTETTVAWGVKLVGGNPAAPFNRLAMGVGWSAMIAAVKDLRCIANEEQDDTIVATWTGSKGLVYQWHWHSRKDAPAKLPIQEGLDKDDAAC